MNSTASWIWLNADNPCLAASYAAHFNISLAQADQDIRLTFDSWSKQELPVITPEVTDKAPEMVPLVAQFTLNGISFQINFATSDVAAELIPRLGPIEFPTQSSLAARPDHFFDLIPLLAGTAIYRDGVHIATESLVTGARAILLQEITRLCVPTREFTLILHAGAVGNNAGCVILAGASFSGKSTLCAALMESGLLCYSDDSACLTADFQLAGMPFALSLREGSWPLFPHLDRPRFLPSNLNGTSPTAFPTALVFVDYRPEAQSGTLEAVATFDALVALQESGFWVEPSKPAITAVLDWVSHLPIHRLLYSDLNEGVAKIRSLLNA